ncbi:MAG TPA: SDR family oxidoreductase [Humisphaera sp.]|jgi:pteridine reductase|nr:SDR family oxidoreductase [Humisphaera sp.]
MADPTGVALITGGAKRVGRSIALRLARGGYDVAFTYNRSNADAQSLVEEIAKIGRRSIAISADLFDLPAAAHTIAREFRGAFDRLDILVNNASSYAAADLASTTLELTGRLWAIHVEAPILLCQEFAGMLKDSGGSIVNMVDLLAQRPWPQYLAYCASKAALANLTLGLARELAARVRVNGIAPGVVEWPPGYPQEQKEQYLRRVPLERAGTPEDVAELVWFLSRPDGYITGQIVPLDGGRSIT